MSRDDVPKATRELSEREQLIDRMMDALSLSRDVTPHPTLDYLLTAIKVKVLDADSRIEQAQRGCDVMRWEMEDEYRLRIEAEDEAERLRAEVARLTEERDLVIGHIIRDTGEPGPRRFSCRTFDGWVSYHATREVAIAEMFDELRRIAAARAASQGGEE